MSVSKADSDDTVRCNYLRFVCLLVSSVDEDGENEGAVLITSNNRLHRSCGGVGEEDAVLLCQE